MVEIKIRSHLNVTFFNVVLDGFGATCSGQCGAWANCNVGG